jgi:hypothetical protein
MHRLLATQAVRVGRRNRLVNAWQMGRQRARLIRRFRGVSPATCVFSSIASALAMT